MEEIRSRLRAQVGAAARYGATSTEVEKRGFPVPGPNEEVLLLDAPGLLGRLRNMSAAASDELIEKLVTRQPDDREFDGWNERDLVALRAIIALRLGQAIGLDERTRKRALARTMTNITAGLTDGARSRFRDGSAGQSISRSELERLYDQIVAELLRGSQELPNQEDDDYLIEAVEELHTYPRTSADPMIISRAVTIRALVDGLAEYRYSVDTVWDGRDSPRPKLLAGPEAVLDRLATRSRGGVKGWEYQVVFRFSKPMMKSDSPKTLKWSTESAVSKEFFEPRDDSTRAVGFRPTRQVVRARVALQFPEGQTPRQVAVLSGVRQEAADTFDVDGLTIPTVDGYVEKEWQNLKRGRFYQLVWPR